MKIYFFIFFITFLSFCKQRKECIVQSEPAGRLEDAWRFNDTAYVREYLNELKKVIGNDTLFYSMVANISDVTNFVYGNIDIHDDYWKSRTDSERFFLKQNTAVVYSIYAKSCLFFKKKNIWGSSLEVQDRYYFDNRFFSNAEKDSILAMVNKLCE